MISHINNILFILIFPMQYLLIAVYLESKILKIVNFYREIVFLFYFI